MKLTVPGAEPRGLFYGICPLTFDTISYYNAWAFSTKPYFRGVRPMTSYRDYLNRFYLSTNRIDGLYYLAARKLGVNENTLALLYELDGGGTRSQKELSQALLIPKTTVNTVIREWVRAGYVRLVSAGRSREKEVALTEAGRAYARQILRPVYAAEEEAMARTLERFPPDFLLAVETLAGQLYQTFQQQILEKEP